MRSSYCYDYLREREGNGEERREEEKERERENKRDFIVASELHVELLNIHVWLHVIILPLSDFFFP